MRFNTTADSAEVYANDDGSGNAGWIEVGAGGAVVGDKDRSDVIMIRLKRI
ncbi:MAG: hypothetical protein CM15mV10_2480 [uncultured marine virus]|nr:MAG: hypothetical protein CM15mV10_2480 [uncultured marine virus]